MVGFNKNFERALNVITGKNISPKPTESMETKVPMLLSALLRMEKDRRREMKQIWRKAIALAENNGISPITVIPPDIGVLHLEDCPYAEVAKTRIYYDGLGAPEDFDENMKIVMTQLICCPLCKITYDNNSKKESQR